MQDNTTQPNTDFKSKDYNSPKVSFFSDVSHTKGTTKPLHECLLTSEYKHAVQRIRNETDQEKIKFLKEQIPCFTPSGIFEPRSDAGLIEHSGFICVDIDGKDNPQITDFTALARQMYELKTTAYAGLSVSGRGVFVLMPLFNVKKHREHFRALQVYFADMGIIIDSSCINVSRLRFVSYNEGFEFRQAKPFTKMIENKIISNVRFKNNNNLNILINKILDKGINITQNREDWRNIAYALKNEPNGNEMFHSLSRLDERYRFEESEKLFESAKGGMITERIIFYIAKNYGVSLK
jgi:hypothetical protein